MTTIESLATPTDRVEFNTQNPHRPATDNDFKGLQPSQRRLLQFFINGDYAPLTSKTLKELTGTKHVTRRISELQARGFEFIVTKSGLQNTYRFTGNVRV